MQYSWSAHCIASCCLLAIYIHYYQGLLFPLDVVRSFIHCIGQATDRLWPDADGTDGQNGRRCLSADSFREGIPRLGMGSGRLTTPRCFPADDRPCLSAPHSLLLSWRRTRFIASVFCLDNHWLEDMVPMHNHLAQAQGHRIFAGPWIHRKSWNDSSNFHPNWQESFAGERLYTLVHLLTVFWLPFMAILAAYVYIVLFLFFYSLRPCMSRPTPSTRPSCDQTAQLNTNNEEGNGTSANEKKLLPAKCIEKYSIPCIE